MQARLWCRGTPCGTSECSSSPPTARCRSRRPSRGSELIEVVVVVVVVVVIIILIMIISNNNNNSNNNDNNSNSVGLRHEPGRGVRVRPVDVALRAAPRV